MFPILAVLIVFLSFFRVAQYFVGLIYLLKFFMRLFIVWIKIGVKLTGQFPVCFLYVVRRRILVNTQYLIIIYELHIPVFNSFCKNDAFLNNTLIPDSSCVTRSYRI